MHGAITPPPIVNVTAKHERNDTAFKGSTAVSLEHAEWGRESYQSLAS